MRDTIHLPRKYSTEPLTGTRGKKFLHFLKKFSKSCHKSTFQTFLYNVNRVEITQIGGGCCRIRSTGFPCEFCRMADIMLCNSSEQHRNEKTDCAGSPAKDCIFISGWAGADRPVDDRLAPTEVERRRPSSLRHMTRKRHIAFEEGGLWPAVLNSYVALSLK